jgi:hypothetical protein
VGWGASRRRRHISWLATQPTIGIDQRLVIQDAVEWLMFEAFVERLLVLRLRPGQSMILDTRKRRESATANAVISRLPLAVTQLTRSALSIR